MDFGEIIVAILSLLGVIIVRLWDWKENNQTRKLSKNTSEDLEAMKHNHSKELIELKETIKRINAYDSHKVSVIASFLSNAKIFLGDSYNQEAYNNFACSAAEVFMYLPETHIHYAKDLTKAIDEIHNFHVSYNDGSYQYRENLISEALELHNEVTDNFKGFGLENPKA